LSRYRKKRSRFTNEKRCTPPTMWDLLAGVRREQLIRVKPGGVALNSSELVDEEVIQVSVRAKRSI